MKTIITKTKFITWLLPAILFFATRIHAQVKTDFVVKSTKSYIQGTSTLHDWESQIIEMGGKGSFQSKNNTIVSITGLELKIPVEGIKSKEGKIMDNKTYEAFLADKNPFITFTFSNTAVKIDASKNVIIIAPGFLTMAGTTKPVTLTANGSILANGDMQLVISQKLKMTDFNMIPPKAVLGTIHVGDEITVYFEIILVKNKSNIN